MEKQPSPHTPASIARNIGIGVITPVLAATIIYFLGINKSDSSDFKKKKEATIKTWSAYIQNKGVLTTVFKQMKNVDSTMEIETMRSNVYHEIDITVDNMENIKKEPNADQRVYSTIDIVEQQIKEMKPMMGKMIDDMIAFSATEPTPEGLEIFGKQLTEDIAKKMLGLVQRDSIRLATFYEGLNKDYNITLPKH
jgi:ribosome-associated translation inhibitor RaiA